MKFVANCAQYVTNTTKLDLDSTQFYNITSNFATPWVSCGHIMQLRWGVHICPVPVNSLTDFGSQIDPLKIILENEKKINQNTKQIAFFFLMKFVAFFCIFLLASYLRDLLTTIRINNAQKLFLLKK